MVNLTVGYFFSSKRKDTVYFYTVKNEPHLAWLFKKKSDMPYSQNDTADERGDAACFKELTTEERVWKKSEKRVRKKREVRKKWKKPKKKNDTTYLDCIYL